MKHCQASEVPVGWNILSVLGFLRGVPSKRISLLFVSSSFLRVHEDENVLEAKAQNFHQGEDATGYQQLTFLQSLLGEHHSLALRACLWRRSSSCRWRMRWWQQGLQMLQALVRVLHLLRRTSQPFPNFQCFWFSSSRFYQNSLLRLPLHQFGLVFCALKRQSVLRPSTFDHSPFFLFLTAKVVFCFLGWLSSTSHRTLAMDVVHLVRSCRARKEVARCSKTHLGPLHSGFKDLVNHSLTVITAPETWA